MVNELYRHKKSDMVKWVVTLLVGLALIAAVVALCVKLDRQTSTTTIGGEAYSVGTIDAETGRILERDIDNDRDCDRRHRHNRHCNDW